MCDYVIKVVDGCTGETVTYEPSQPRDCPRCIEKMLFGLIAKMTEHNGKVIEANRLLQVDLCDITETVIKALGR